MKTMPFNAEAQRTPRAAEPRNHGQAVVDCGGKRSATPLWQGDGLPAAVYPTKSESGVGYALGHCSPKVALREPLR
jgi:hypothetical protein